MLKRLIPVIALAFAACSSSSTAPASTSISVRVLDDRGDPVYRTVVMVTFDSQQPVSVLTKHDGTARVDVKDVGEYFVRVVPKSGYDGSTGAVIKRVTVTENTTTSVDFTIFRSGLPGGV